MAHATAPSTTPGAHHAEHGGTATSGHGHGHGRHAPITPGKVAMWLFLATEIMFFTGLIGSYIVLRMGSPASAYSNLYPPGTDLTRLAETKGVKVVKAGGLSAERLAEILHKEGGLTEAEAHHAAEHAPGLVTGGMPEAEAAKVRDAITAGGGDAELEPLKMHKWPLPYDHEINPLSIDLTAVNTFILICSSVTMVLALAAVQRGDRARMTLFLALTLGIGGTFLGVQVYEYYALMSGHYYPVGISKTHHFTPDVSLFGSCFFTMTGFHGAHVFGGLVSIACLLIGALMGKFTREHHAPVELIGLYWHFVDLVWIILFTVVYLI